MSKKRKYFDLSDDESVDGDKLVPFLLYPGSRKDDRLDSSSSDDDEQFGMGVTTRRQAALANLGAVTNLGQPSSPLISLPVSKRRKKKKLETEPENEPEPEQSTSPTEAKSPVHTSTRSPTPGPSRASPPRRSPSPSLPRRSPSPTPGPSRTSPPRRSPSPTPGPSLRESPVPGTSRELPDVEKEINDNFFEKEKKIFENGDFILVVQRTDHQRQKVIMQNSKHANIKIILIKNKFI